jgi:hypothetical protein
VKSERRSCVLSAVQSQQFLPRALHEQAACTYSDDNDRRRSGSESGRFRPRQHSRLEKRTRSPRLHVGPLSRWQRDRRNAQGSRGGSAKFMGVIHDLRIWHGLGKLYARRKSKDGVRQRVGSDLVLRDQRTTLQKAYRRKDGEGGQAVAFRKPVAATAWAGFPLALRTRSSADGLALPRGDMSRRRGSGCRPVQSALVLDNLAALRPTPFPSALRSGSGVFRAQGCLVWLTQRRRAC